MPHARIRPRPRVGKRSIIPPMGQGLAVIASVMAIGFATLLLLLGYFWSMHIAAARAQQGALDVKMGAARAQIGQLRMEYEVRSRFNELKRWSAPLDLQPTGEGQYAATPGQLKQLATIRSAQLASGDLARCAATGGRLAPGCDPAPSGGGNGYTPHAREALDTLIGDMAH